MSTVPDWITEGFTSVVHPVRIMAACKLPRKLKDKGKDKRKLFGYKLSELRGERNAKVWTRKWYGKLSYILFWNKEDQYANRNANKYKTVLSNNG